MTYYQKSHSLLLEGLRPLLVCLFIICLRLFVYVVVDTALKHINIPVLSVYTYIALFAIIIVLFLTDQNSKLRSINVS